MEVQRRFEREDVVITDLTRSTNVLDGYVFYRCRMSGPAAISIGDDCIFAYNSTSAGPKGLFWEMPTDWQAFAGGIILTNCTIEECWFHRVGFVHTREGLRGIRNTLALNRSDPGFRGYYSQNPSP